MKNDYRPDGNNYMFRNIIINCSSKYPKMFNMDEWGFNPYYVNREPLGIANPEIKGNDIVTKDYKVDQRVVEEIGFSQLPFEEIGNY